MSKIINSIYRLLKNTTVSSSSPSSIKQLFITTNPSIKKPNLPTSNTLVPYFSRTLTSKQSLFSNNFISRKIFSISCSQASLSSEVDGIKKERSIPVRAYCLSDSIDLEGLMVENQAILVPHTPGTTGSYAVLRFGDSPSPRDSTYSYVVVFPYGSVISFNVHDDHEVGSYLKIIKRHASGPLLPHQMIKNCIIDYEVRENPDLQTWMQGGLNCMMLQQLNIDGMCTIASVLGQSVALDHYSRLADAWVAEYSGLNSGLERRGTLGSLIKLFKLYYKKKRFATAIYRFGLSERSDIAWREDTKHSEMLDYLRDKFSLTLRFEGLDRMFKIGELNARFVDEQVSTMLAASLMHVIVISLTMIPVRRLLFSTLRDSSYLYLIYKGELFVLTCRHQNSS
ncbi:hypothetical protein MKW94_012317 [Papaver nudicaule]|uniref:DUF155 domain-containing protein n=1 Tax=Papaver nudicaule TaxID=74823 RepID=A0AA41RW61_PAPNU|nr:hypothetical protein [Papaver nudicaule]